MSKRLKYDYNLLKEICDDAGVTLLHDYSKDYVTRDTRVIAKCLYCDLSFNKSLNKLHKQRNFGCLACAKDLKFNRIKNTMLEKYGVEYAAQSPELYAKQEITMRLKYGFYSAVQNEAVKQKIRDTNLERYGCEYGLSNKEVIKKREKTNLERYGVRNPLQRPEIQEKATKSAFRFKTYKLPSGKEIQLQGYEPFGIDYLLNVEHIREEEIVTGSENVPLITYKDNNGVERKHFVDIYLPKTNKCIEIKSSWTFTKNTEHIFLKQQFAKEANFAYEIWVFGHKGERLKVYN